MYVMVTYNSIHIRHEAEQMIKPLKRTTRPALFHIADGVRVEGPHAGLWGDCSGLSGDCSGLSGDCSGLSGNFSGLLGNCSGLLGNLNDIPEASRPCDLSDFAE